VTLDGAAALSRAGVVILTIESWIV